MPLDLRGAADVPRGRARRAGRAGGWGCDADAPDLRRVERLRRARRASRRARVRDRHRRQVHAPARRLQEHHRGVHPRRRRQRRARASCAGSRPADVETRAGGRAARPTWTASWCRAASASAASRARSRRSRFARERGVPFFGICLGMQVRDHRVRAPRGAAGRRPTRASSTRTRAHPVIDLMAEQAGISEKGGTMRLGAYRCALARGQPGRARLRPRPRSRSATATATSSTTATRAQLQSRGLVLSGRCVGRDLVEIVELPDHPWFLGVQFHPELKSRPARAAPAVRGLRARGPRAAPRAAAAATRSRRRPGSRRAPRRRRREGRREPLRHRRRRGRRPGLLVIAGPCVVESAEACLEVAARAEGAVRRARAALRLQGLLPQGQPLERALLRRARPATRRSACSPRVRRELGVPVLTDVHEAAEVAGGGRGGRRAADPGLPLPPDRAAAGGGAQRPGGEREEGAVPAARRTCGTRSRSCARRGGERILLTERGTSFGYRDLVVDMRGLVVHARAGLAGRLRRHPQPAAPGRRRDRRRPALRLPAAARGGRLRRGRALPRVPPRPGARPLRRGDAAAARRGGGLPRRGGARARGRGGAGRERGARRRAPGGAGAHPVPRRGRHAHRRGHHRDARTATRGTSGCATASR